MRRIISKNWLTNFVKNWKQEIQTKNYFATNITEANKNTEEGAGVLIRNALPLTPAIVTSYECEYSNKTVLQRKELKLRFHLLLETQDRTKEFEKG